MYIYISNIRILCIIETTVEEMDSTRLHSSCITNCFSSSGRGYVRDLKSSCSNLCCPSIELDIHKSWQAKPSAVNQSIMTQLGGVVSSVLKDGFYVAEEVTGRLMPNRTDDAAICDPHSGIFNVSETDAISVFQTARTSKPTSLDSVLFQEILEAVFPVFR